MKSIFSGVRFNEKHSFYDYGMFAVKGGLDRGSPAPKTRLVDIPGADGLLDLTESAGGIVRYGNRPMSLLFSVRVDDDRRSALQDELVNDLHGKQVAIVFDDDPDWIYEGRATVAFEDIEDWRMKVRVSVDAKPYKFARDMTELSIGASSFAQDDIFVGRGLEAQVGSSIFYDVGNVSNMSKLVLSWDADCPKVGPLSLSISDGTNSYTTSSFSYSDYGVEVAVSSLSSLDTTAIKRVVLSGIRFASLYLRSTAVAVLTVVNDRMPVCPYWENPNSGSIALYVNGKYFSLGAGETYNPDIVLNSGENEIALTSASVPTYPLVMRFREGRL